MQRSATYQFGFLTPRDYKHALELDQQSGSSNWYDATQLEMDQINKYGVFDSDGKASFDPKTRKNTNAPPGY